VWITKMLAGGKVDDVWIRAHKDYAWPKREK